MNMHVEQHAFKWHLLEWFRFLCSVRRTCSSSVSPCLRATSGVKYILETCRYINTNAARASSIHILKFPSKGGGGVYYLIPRLDAHARTEACTTPPSEGRLHLRPCCSIYQQRIKSNSTHVHRRCAQARNDGCRASAAKLSAISADRLVCTSAVEKYATSQRALACAQCGHMCRRGGVRSPFREVHKLYFEGVKRTSQTTKHRPKLF